MASKVSAVSGASVGHTKAIRRKLEPRGKISTAAQTTSDGELLPDTPPQPEAASPCQSKNMCQTLQAAAAIQTHTRGRALQRQQESLHSNLSQNCRMALSCACCRLTTKLSHAGAEA